jgi:hypothetical protein
MAGGQCKKLHALTLEKRIVTDEERADSQLDEGSEGAIDLTFALGIENMNSLADGASRRLYVFQSSRGIWIVRVQQHSDCGDSGHKLAQQF